jgi:hypothetical protein
MSGIALDLPSDVLQALQPLFDVLPLDKAMPELVPIRPTWEAAYEVADRISQDPALRVPALQAGLWLYADDLHRSHEISQGMSDSTGAMWHAIMHRREGDFSNSRYWLRQAGAHPAFGSLEEYDTHRFWSAVESAHEHNPPELIDLQRQEWLALFRWCAMEGA